MIKIIIIKNENGKWEWVVLVLRLSRQFLFYIYFFMKNVKNTNKKHLINIQPNIFISKKASK